MKLKKICISMLAMSMLFTCSNAFAAEKYVNSTKSFTTGEAEAGINETIVSATVGENYTVIIPKKITLDGESKTGDYKVSVTGDIAGDHYVSVVPETSFSMSQSGKDNVTADVEQSKNKFYPAVSTKALSNNESHFGENVTGTISADDLSAGLWEGDFNFNISLN